MPVIFNVLWHAEIKKRIVLRLPSGTRRERIAGCRNFSFEKIIQNLKKNPEYSSEFFLVKSVLQFKIFS